MSTFTRLLGFLRPHRKGVVWSFLLAFGALGGTVLIPYLTGLAINAVRAHDHHKLVLLAFAITGAGLVRLVLSVLRRLIAGQVSLGVELDLRNRLYGQLQRLELSFFDRQQTGQLMSRATVDLQSVRFFLGYGLIFIAQSLVTILLAAVAMFLLQPALAAISLAPVPVRGADRQPLRAQVAPGHAGGSAANRRADRRCRGERLRRPRGQGVLPGGAPARSLPATPPSECSPSRSAPLASRPCTRR